MTIKELSEKFNEGSASANSKHDIFDLEPFINEISMFIDYLRKAMPEEIYLKQYLMDDETFATEIEYKRTAFSKTKYFAIYRELSLLGYIPKVIKYEKIETGKYDCGYKYEVGEIIHALETYICALKLQLVQSEKIVPLHLEKEIEPIAPKGNPYAGENWKDKKHKFKGGKRR